MRAPLLVALLLVVSSCDTARDSEIVVGEGYDGRSLYSYAAAAPAPNASLEERHYLARSSPLVRADSTGFTPALAMSSTMLIRTARVSLEVDSLDGAVSAARDVANRFGGFVAGFARNSAASWRPAATLTVRVPVQQLDAVVTAVSGLGHAESVQLAAQDVGEEFVDVTARLENARRLERRLLDLLAKGTGQLKDVLQVEEALARVREDVERIEGRRRYLQTRSEMSTLELTLHEAGPAAGPRVSSTASEAFGQAWRNFLMLTAAVIAASGVFVPLGVLAVGAWVAVRRSRRRPATAPATTL